MSLTPEQKPQVVTTTVVEKTIPAPPPAPVGSVEKTVTFTRTTTPIEAFGRWSAGLIAGFIGGGAHAASAALVMQAYDPVQFQEMIIRCGLIFLSSGVVSTLIYLKRHPIPDEWNPETSEDRRSSKR
jgi:hypothetical protein